MENLFPTESKTQRKPRTEKTLKNASSDALGQQRNLEFAEVDDAHVRFGTQRCLVGRFPQSLTQVTVNLNGRSDDGADAGILSSWFSVRLCASGGNMFLFPLLCRFVQYDARSNPGV